MIVGEVMKGKEKKKKKKLMSSWVFKLRLFFLVEGEISDEKLNKAGIIRM